MTDLLGQFYQFLASWFAARPAPEPEPIPEPAPTPAPPPPPLPAPPSPGTLVLAAINSIRATDGLPALTEDESLSRLATSWAASMATTIGLDHGDFAGRIAAVFPNIAAGENIAEGQPDATSVVDAWMGDPPHRANILGDYNRLGIGIDHDEAGSIFWCADFAQID